VRPERHRAAAVIPAQPSASILPPPPKLPPFDGSQYSSIDVQAAAQRQYGPSATAVVVSSHLYGWRAKVGTQLYSIDMQRTVRDQFGSGYILGAVGVGIYDWRAVRVSGLQNRVLPVMAIAYEYFYDVDAVRTGLANFQSVLITTRNWYAARAGKAYRMLEPLVVFNQSPVTAGQWKTLAANTALPGHTFDFWTAALAEWERAYPAVLPVLASRVIVPLPATAPMSRSAPLAPTEHRITRRRDLLDQPQSAVHVCGRLQLFLRHLPERSELFAVDPSGWPSLGRDYAAR